MGLPSQIIKATLEPLTQILVLVIWVFQAELLKKKTLFGWVSFS